MRLHIVTDLLNISICILHIPDSSTQRHCDNLCKQRTTKTTECKLSLVVFDSELSAQLIFSFHFCGEPSRF